MVKADFFHFYFKKCLVKQNFVLNLQPLKKVLAHGVMVTLRFLVPSFKVRILVGQLREQCKSWYQLISGFFVFMIYIILF